MHLSTRNRLSYITCSLYDSCKSSSMHYAYFVRALNQLDEALTEYELNDLTYMPGYKGLLKEFKLFDRSLRRLIKIEKMYLTPYNDVNLSDGPNFG